MIKEELKKLEESLKNKLKEIDSELSQIALENPLVEGDFDVKVADLGASQEDAAQEAVELDRNQAMVDVLERERKKITHTLESIKSGNYGRCEICSVEINPTRLKVIPETSLCMSCADKKPQ